MPLTNTVAGEIIAEKRLPIRLTALTECFRSEAGAAGRDTRGYLRQHQFRKVELVSIAHPEASDAEHERMTGCAERVLETAEPAVPPGGAVLGRYRVRRGEDLRPRGLAAGAADVAGDLLLLEHAAISRRGG